VKEDVQEIANAGQVASFNRPPVEHWKTVAVRAVRGRDFPDCNFRDFPDCDDWTMSSSLTDGAHVRWRGLFRDDRHWRPGWRYIDRHRLPGVSLVGYRKAPSRSDTGERLSNLDI